MENNDLGVSLADLVRQIEGRAKSAPPLGFQQGVSEPRSHYDQRPDPLQTPCIDLAGRILAADVDTVRRAVEALVEAMKIPGAIDPR